MTHLVKIGNSQGIRIPKPFIEQAHLSGSELKLEVTEHGLLIAPIVAPRQGWKESIQTTLSTHGTEVLDQEWLNADLTDDSDLEWQ